MHATTIFFNGIKCYEYFKAAACCCSNSCYFPLLYNFCINILQESPFVLVVSYYQGTDSI